jgi:hypothetical protein
MTSSEEQNEKGIKKINLCGTMKPINTQPKGVSGDEGNTLKDYLNNYEWKLSRFDKNTNP